MKRLIILLFLIAGSLFTFGQNDLTKDKIRARVQVKTPRILFDTTAGPPTITDYTVYIIDSTLYWHGYPVLTLGNFSATEINLVGDVTGSGTQTITVTVADDSHAHTGSTVSALAVANFSSPNVSNWTNDAGYITDGNTNWDNSYGFITGETSHADVVVDGDFTSQGIILRGASGGIYSILTDNSANWNTAYGWGNHASAGYLTSQTSHADVVQDGDFTSQGIMLRGADAGSYSILTDNSSNWNTAYGWGNHASAGYLTSEVYPGAGIAVSTGSAWTTSIANNSANWNTAYGWGNHAGLYEPVLGNPAGDGYVLSSTAEGIRSWVSQTGGMVYPGTGIPVSTGSAWGSSITDNSANWNTAYGWGNHASAGYLTSETSHADVVIDGDFTSQGIMLRGASGGIYSILTDNSANWNTSYGWGNHAGLYFAKGDSNTNGNSTTKKYVDDAIGGISEMTYPGAGIPLSTGSAWGSSITDNSTNWNTAYGWGNHASAGYLTSETSHADVIVDGDFTSQGIMLRGASGGTYSILTDNSSNWNTAYGWGNHASAGYITGVGTGTQNTLTKWSTTTTLGSSIIYDDGTKIGIGAAATYYLDLIKSSVGSATAFRVSNPDNTNAASDAKVIISVGGSSSGDPYVFFTGPSNWSMGIDNSDADKFKIAVGFDGLGLGGDKFIMTTTGAATLVSTLSLGNGAYTFPSTAGTPLQSIRMPSTGNTLEWFTPEAGEMIYPGAGIALSTGSAWGSSITDNSANWNTAYGWGNHAGLYFAKGDSNTNGNPTTKKYVDDAIGGISEMTYPGAGIPLSTGSAWGSSITDNSANWNTAYGWGNHASAGYLTSEVDGSTSNEIQSLTYTTTTGGLEISGGNSVTLPWSLADGTNPNKTLSHSTTNVSNVQFIKPVRFDRNGLFSGPAAKDVASFYGYVLFDSTIRMKNLVTNSTPAWMLVVKDDSVQKASYTPFSFPSSGIPVSTGSAWGTSITDNSSNWNTAYGWGNHASAGYLTSETSHSDVVVDGDFTSQGIMLRGADAGTYSILTDNSANWNTAYGWGNHASAGYIGASGVTYENLSANGDIGTGAAQVSQGNHTHSTLPSAGDTVGEMMYWDGDSWEPAFGKFLKYAQSDTMMMLIDGFEFRWSSTAKLWGRAEQIFTDGVMNAYSFNSATGITTKKLEIDPTPDTDHQGSGTTVTMTAAVSVNFGDVCYVNSSGKLALVDADAIATSSGTFMALETISADAAGEFLMQGFARDDTWNWTVGGLIYISTTGTTGNTLTQTAPSGTGDVVQIVGVATHADRMTFNPNLAQVEIQ